MSMVNDTKNFLASNFAMKDIGEANVILRINIAKCDECLISSQEHYVEKFLKKRRLYKEK